MKQLRMMESRFRRVRFTAFQAAVAIVLIATQPLADESIEKKSKKQTVQDTTTMKLRGGQEGTLFESLRIEGEDRVRIQFERPDLNLNPETGGIQGLEWESVYDVIDRSGVNPISPFLAGFAGKRVACYARPWLNMFLTGGIVHFRPAMEGVDRWRLLVADSKGDTVASFQGKGKPPKEIVWDGRSLDGSYVPPGLTCSYVLEAYDKAGNKRSFVGDGFELQSYRIESDDYHMMLFSGTDLTPPPTAFGENSMPPPILLEVASWLNQERNQQSPVRIEITARDFREAKRMADEIMHQLEPHLLGDVLRIQQVTTVESDAPESGAIAIVVSR